MFSLSAPATPTLTIKRAAHRHSRAAGFKLLRIATNDGLLASSPTPSSDVAFATTCLRALACADPPHASQHGRVLVVLRRCKGHTRSCLQLLLIPSILGESITGVVGSIPQHTSSRGDHVDVASNQTARQEQSRPGGSTVT